jgi:A/G-specific adenine glycosylase
VDGDPAGELPKVLGSGYSLKVQWKEAVGVVQHAYTHFKVTVHAFRCELPGRSDPQNLKWVAVRDLDAYPMGKIDRRIAERIKKQTGT